MLTYVVNKAEPGDIMETLGPKDECLRKAKQAALKAVVDVMLSENTPEELDAMLQITAELDVVILAKVGRVKFTLGDLPVPLRVAEGEDNDKDDQTSS
jgi:hypothetical protein